RFEDDGSVMALSGWTTVGGYNYVGKRYPLDGTVSGLIFESGRPGRVENYADAPGEAPEAAREMGWRSSVGAPITVDGHLWGVLAVTSRSEQQLPPETEQRLAEFAELFATAIANGHAHEQLAQLADEQAALRRVATLVAEGALGGVVTVGSGGAERLPADAECRLAKFTELLATAIAKGEAHEQLALLADEQAALRRVATLVAEGATPHRVFDAVRH